MTKSAPKDSQNDQNTSIPFHSTPLHCMSNDCIFGICCILGIFGGRASKLRAFLARQKWGGALRKTKNPKQMFFLTSGIRCADLDPDILFWRLLYQQMTKMHPFHSTPLHCIPSIHSIFAGPQMLLILTPPRF